MADAGATQRYAGRVVLVTGGGSGLGRAVALGAAAEGATVVAADLSEAGLAETVKAAGAAGEIHTTVGDVSTREGAHGIVEAAVGAAGGLDVLINVAGVLRNGPFIDLTEADVQLVLGVNLAGTMWVAQAAIPHLLARAAEPGPDGGTRDVNICNIASNAGLMGTAYTTIYAASKAGVVSFTRSLAMEYIKSPLRVNAVAPGGIETPMTQAVTFADDTDFDLVRPYMGFRKMSRPEEIAAVVLFVASGEASAMTGSIVSADTGITAG